MSASKLYSLLLGSMNVNEYGAISLGQLIDTLEQVPYDLVVEDGFGEPDSWRGVYAFLRFQPQRNAIAGEMLQHARSAVGSTYEGYKGGEFTMTRDTPCFIDGYGACSDNAAITPERLKRMVSVTVAEPQASGLPTRPKIIEMHIYFEGDWGVFIPSERWEEFQSYVCKLEAIAARSNVALAMPKSEGGEAK